MNKNIYIVIIATLVVLVNAKFPDEPKPCKHGDSECIIKVINDLLQKKSEGDSSWNLVKIDPLAVSKIAIKQGAESPVNIDLKFTNNLIYGFKDSSAVKVKGFGKDLTQKHEVHLRLKQVSMVGDYSISGKVLILPISGSGKSNVSLIDTDVKIMFSGTPMQKNGETFMKINNLKLDVNPGRIIYNFTNLFNGDKELGDNMNVFLNENWKDIFQEIKVTLTAAFAQIYQSVINNVFKKYPYEKYFANEG